MVLNSKQMTTIELEAGYRSLMKRVNFLECQVNRNEYSTYKRRVRDEAFLPGLAVDVCTYFEIEMDVFSGKTRFRDLVEARMIFSFLAYSVFKRVNNIGKDITYEKIADLVAKDHATIIHYQKKFAELFEIDKKFHNKVYEFVRAVFGDYIWKEVKVSVAKVDDRFNEGVD